MFSKRALAFLSLLFIALGFAAMRVASRWMDEGLGNFTQVFLRVFGALILVTIIFHKQVSWKRIFHLKPKDWMILIAIGTLGYAVMIYSITRAALLTNLVSVSVLYSTVPFWVYLYGLILSRQKFSWRAAGLLVVSSWGIGMIASGQLLPNLGKFGLGEWLALAAAAFDAVWYMGIKLLEGKLNSREITVGALAIASISTFIMKTWLGEPFSFSVFSNWHVLSALTFGILQNGWVTLLMAFSLKYVDEVVATQIMLIESIYAIGFGYFLYAEIISPVQALGTLIIIASVYLMNKLQTT
jgi:drug/metabolite transporter (DMT)-like permease